MADSLLKDVLKPAGMVEPPRKTEDVKLPAPEISKVKGLGVVAVPVTRVTTK